MTEDSQNRMRQISLDYHAYPKPGKLEVRATKPLANQLDLARAYSPGVAEACLEIKHDAANSMRYTGRGNLVAVISNGTAVLGLGDIGPLAAKPVMEGKAVLFKKFANINCFDIEIAETDPKKLAKIICALEPCFGAVNLEDIKAPDCFIVEKLCQQNMNIPVFHDDQHGTAIVVAAAVKNACLVAKKAIESLKIVSLGGGAAGIACLDMLVKMGVFPANIWLFDRQGLVHTDRAQDSITPEKMTYARSDGVCSLSDAMTDADLFLGLSSANVLDVDLVKRMSDPPIIFALANPTPEVMPEDVKRIAPNAIIATGRTDYPNQVNNVLCFPFIFRGALDVSAREINDEMKLACVDSLAALARKTTTAEAAAAYEGETMSFGSDYLIPKPFDPRLMGVIAPAVAKAAMRSKVARQPIKDLDEYKNQLNNSVFRSALLMRPVFAAAATSRRRIVFAEGEDERVLHAVVHIIEEMVDEPILIGRPDVITTRCERLGLTIRPNRDFALVNPEDDPRYREYWQEYHYLMARRGVPPDLAKTIMRTNTTAIAAVMVHRGEADSLICGTVGQYLWHLKYVTNVLARDHLHPVGALSVLIHEEGPLFVADTHIHTTPTPERIAATVTATARHIRRFGIDPQIALCTNAQFGNLDSESSQRMRLALNILDKSKPDFVYEGEMHTDTALNQTIRDRILPNARLKGAANALIYAGTDAANAVRHTLKFKANALEVGPILMGMGNCAHIVTPSITARGLLNIAALAGTPVSQYS